MTKQKLMDIAASTAKELRLNSSVRSKSFATDGRGYTEPTNQTQFRFNTFHSPSFLRGVEFAWNQLKGKK